ncbi:MAG: sigma 54-interacting transcriptional regulator [Deltaproteobacteria bacterium]|nr:sigma 54-interacting transcriptional regulator [Deltaproteobacteria bacterium]
METKQTVLIGFLGTALDRGPRNAQRWELWRPSVGICQQDDLLIDVFELLHSRRFTALAEQIAADITSVSPETRVVLHGIEIQDAWDFEEVYGVLLDFARSYSWNLDEREYLLHITTGTHVAQICLFLLAEARYFPAKLVQSSPPAPPERDSRGTYRIIDLDLSKYDSIISRFHKVRSSDLSFLKSGIATRNENFNQLIERIERVALASKEPMLLLGPTGAGKSRLAKRVYELKKSRNQLSGAFVDVNCATIRGDAAMSALFGHVKGAFTGAVQKREGYLLSANGGMLFLDEIGELGPDEQAMLLRALEEKTFFPVGADGEARSDFQLIAGSNRDLQSLARQGSFRDDLLARINLWSFKLPGLNERQEDIAPNIEYELERYAEKHNRQISLNKEARELFLRFATSPLALWQANFRDLNAAVTRMATLSSAGRITVEIVEEEIRRLTDAWQTADSLAPHEELYSYFGITRHTLEELDKFDRVQLVEVLKVCKQCRSLAEAGRLLFAHSGKEKPNYNPADRLRKYLARFNIAWKGRSHQSIA